MASSSEAALEVTLLSLTLPTTPTRCYAVAWLDPTTKQTTSRIPRKPPKNPPKLYFSISPQTLDASLTIQILSRSRLPFHAPKLLAAAVLPLSSVPIAATAFALPLRRPSGEVRGTVCVSARVLWDLGFRRLPEVVDFDWGSAVESVAPSAPPEPESVGSPPELESVESPPERGRGRVGLGLVLGAFGAVVVGAVVSRSRRGK